MYLIRVSNYFNNLLLGNREMTSRPLGQHSSGGCYKTTYLWLSVQQPPVRNQLTSLRLSLHPLHHLLPPSVAPGPIRTRKGHKLCFHDTFSLNRRDIFWKKKKITVQLQFFGKSHKTRFYKSYICFCFKFVAVNDRCFIFHFYYL